MRIIVVLAVIALGAIGLAAARDQPEAESIRAVIERQLAAFRADDAPTAFSFAAPAIQQQFRDPAAFLSMVRRGYAPLYRARTVSFGPIDDHHGATIQIVDVVAASGEAARALYVMERQDDGAWRIAGCILQARPDLGI